jgi:hypothetical protein
MAHSPECSGVLVARLKVSVLGGWVRCAQVIKGEIECIVDREKEVVEFYNGRAGVYMRILRTILILQAIKIGQLPENLD